MQGMRRDAGREGECTGGGGKGKDNHTASHHTISPYNKTTKYCNNTATTLHPITPYHATTRLQHTATTLQQHYNNTATHLLSPTQYWHQ